MKTPIIPSLAIFYSLVCAGPPNTGQCADIPYTGGALATASLQAGDSVLITGADAATDISLALSSSRSLTLAVSDLVQNSAAINMTGKTGITFKAGTDENKWSVIQYPGAAILELIAITGTIGSVASGTQTLAFEKVMLQGGKSSALVYGGGNTTANELLIEGSLAFYDNCGTNMSGGAINSVGSLTFTGTTIFANNYVTGANRDGGAFAAGTAGAAQTVTFQRNVLFVSNTAIRNGGAMYALANGATININGTSLFYDNKAVNGGAIYTGGDLFIGSGAEFRDNIAGTNGGAIYYATAGKTLTLSAETDDIIFRGNKSASSSTPTPNAIYFAQASTFVMNAEAGKTIYFYDPLGGGNSVLTVTKNGEGTVVFYDHLSNNMAATTVNAGKFALSNGAIFGRKHANAFFTLESSGTLSGNGSIRAGTATIKDGATLEVTEAGRLFLDYSVAATVGSNLKLAGSGTISAGGLLNASVISPANADPQEAAILTLSNPLTLADGAVLNHDLYSENAADKIVVVSDFFMQNSATIALGMVESGTFALLSWSGTGLIASDAANIAITANGTTLTARNHAAIAIDEVGKTLSVTNQVTSLGLIWTGAESVVWTTAPGHAANWTATEDIAEKYFRNGDSIVFDGDAAVGNRVVTLANDVVVSQLRVAGTASHNFKGTGGITLDARSVLDGSVITIGTSGKLIKEGSGLLAFENTGTNVFSNGIDHFGGTISFNSAAQLFTESSTIVLTNNASLKAAAAIGDFSSALAVVAPADSGKFDTGVFSVNYSGTLAGSGTFIKLGEGAFTFTTNGGAGFSGKTHVDRGSFLITNDIIFGGDAAVVNGAVAGGAGTFSGNVSVTGASLRVGGFATSSTLVIGGTLSLHNAKVRFGLFAGGMSDMLTIATGGTLVFTGSNTIDISAPGIGVYNLGNIGGLHNPSTTVTIDGQAQIVGGRQQATLSSTSNNILLLSYNADQSRNLIWSGSSSAMWSNADSNWQGSAVKYASGDSVLFAGSLEANHIINIDGSGVRVSNMTVAGADNYTFTGAGITGDPASIVLDNGTSEIVNPLGKLTKNGSGTLTFANAANTFLGGIEITGGVLAFASANQIDTGATGIFFSGNSMFRAIGDDIALSNKIVIADGVTVLVDTGAHTLTLGGALSGAAGTIAKIGNGTLIYSGAGALGHAATRIDAGVVAIRDISNAEVSQVTHEFTFNGGWLDLSDTSYAADGTTANAWNHIALSGSVGGVIGNNDKITLGNGSFSFNIGHATDTNKQGVFVVVDAGNGVASMSGENNYAGYTMLKSGTLRITADAQLGLVGLNREIIFDGPGATLEIAADNVTSARQIVLRQSGAISVEGNNIAVITGAISGTSRVLTKGGEGTLVLSGASEPGIGFDITAGALEGSSASLRGNITNNARVIFNQGESGNYQGIITGTGSFEKRGVGALAFMQANNYSGNTHVLEGTLRAGSPEAFSRSSAHIVNTAAVLDLGGFDQTLKSLQADGLIVFDATINPEDGFIDHANKLIVVGALTGSGTIYVRVAEDKGLSTGTESVEIINSGSGTDVNKLKTVLSERIVKGIYDLTPKLDSNGTLTLAAEIASAEVQAASALPTISLLMGQVGLDSPAHRLGEVRYESDSSNTLWMRGIYHEDKITGALYEGTHVRTGGAQVGVDVLYFTNQRSKNRTVFGVFSDIYDTSAKFDSGATIGGRQYALGVYGSFIKKCWYMDMLVRYGMIDLDIDAPGNHIQLDGKSLGASLETGYSFGIGTFGHLEPSLQLVYQQQKLDNNVDRYMRDYQFESPSSLIGRSGIRWSARMPIKNASYLTPWLRVSGGYEFRADKAAIVKGIRLRNDMSGSIFIVDGGINLAIGESICAYGSILWSNASAVESISASAGVRFMW